MPESSQGQVEPSSPSWRFWLLTILAFPVAGVALIFAFSTVRAPVALAALGSLALEAKLLTYERTVRHMGTRRRRHWIVLGCVATAAVTALVAGVVFFALLIEHCEEGC